MKKIIMVVVLVLFVASAAFADWNEMQKIFASDGSFFANFGISSSISGDFAVAGAYLGRDEDYEATGSAYIYNYDGENWNEHTKLLASDGIVNAHYGLSSSIDGNFAIIGAPSDCSAGFFAGAAYIYNFDGTNWVEQIKITETNVIDEQGLGTSVAISGNFAVIGVPMDDENGYHSGSAYIYYYNGINWVEHVKLTASDSSNVYQFGTCVSIDGNFAMVGSPENRSVHVYFFDGSDWTEQAILTASAGSNDDSFGSSISIDDNFAVIGAFGGIVSTVIGSAYVFYFDGSEWIEQEILMASDGFEFNHYGCSVSISGNIAVIGAQYDDEFGQWSGASYIYNFDGLNWTEVTKIVASDGAEFDKFGTSVSVDSDFLIVGAIGDDGNADDSGTAYIFHNDGLGFEEVTIPHSIPQLSNYPNPFNPTTTIEFSIQNDSEVDLTIFNLKGQKIKTLANNKFNVGSHSIIWNGDDNLGNPVSSGIYYYELNINGKTEFVKKCLLLK